MSLDQDEFAEDMIELNCNGCGKETERCRCQELVCAFNTTNKHLYKMHLLDKLAGYTLTNLIQERITAHVEETCKGVFDASHIKNLQKVGDICLIAQHMFLAISWLMLFKSPRSYHGRSPIYRCAGD